MSAALPDLQQCADEPIEYPGSVQPHGVLLVVNESTRTLLSASDNLTLLLPDAPPRPGSALTEVLGRELSDEVSQRLVEDDLSEPIRWAGPRTGPWAARTVDVMLHRAGGRLVIEFEAVSDTSRGRSVSLSATRAAIEHLNRGATAAEVLTLLTRAVRRVTGFDRVMVYRFDRQWHGEVIAEDRLPALEPLLGLRYPESDIPAQARRLYTLNRLRFIVDSHAVASRLIPQIPDDGADELDMSFAPLRSVSPVHLEYLVGMGVRASMSVSMVRHGKLWGLVACHHYAATLQPSHDERAAADLLTQAALQIVSEREAAHDALRLAEGREHLERLTTRIRNAGMPPVHVLSRGDLNELTDLAGGTGLILRSGDEWTRWGQTVDDTRAQRIVAELHRFDAVPAASDNLSSLHAELASHDVAGALLLRLSQNQWMLWLRKATEQKIRWAGDRDDKTITIRADGTARIGPRRSFAAEQEIVRGRSIPWDSWRVQTVAELGEVLLAVTRTQEHEALAVAEDLHHALLPTRLPTFPELELQVRYLPSPGGRFAGDWWDVFTLPNLKVALVVGDVTGHGSAAAATMAQLRTALRAYLIEGRSPAETLARLDGLAHLLFPTKLATVVLAVIDLKSGELQISRAGHPYPILADRTHAGPLHVPARPPIGLGLESSADTWTATLAAGEILVLHSDGLYERRDLSLAQGTRLIAAAALSHTAADEPLATVADRLISAVPGSTDDDTTMLLARWNGQRNGTRPPRTSHHDPLNPPSPKQ